MVDVSDFVTVSSSPGNVRIITLAGNGEHRFNCGSIAAIQRALDQVEEDPNAAALILTNEGRFFSSGLDLAEIKDSGSAFKATILDFHQLLKRMLLFPIPAIAVICGHAAAAGCMLVLACDYRIMSAERGYIFLSEVDIKLPLTPGMNAVVQSKVPGSAFYKAVLSGYRFTAKTAEEHGFVDSSLPDASSTFQEGSKRATALAARKFDRTNYRALKMEMFKAQIKELDHGGLGLISLESTIAKL